MRPTRSEKKNGLGWRNVEGWGEGGVAANLKEGGLCSVESRLEMHLHC